MGKVHSALTIVPPAPRSASESVGSGSQGAQADATSPTGGATITGVNPISSPVRNWRRQV
jgi:hypothetical protein